MAKFGAGKRASDFMQKANLEGELKDKILAVAGVTQVVTYILSGEVDAGFINQAGLNAHKDEFGSFILIDKALYAPANIVATAFILVLSRGLGEVGITLILGGNIIGKTDTISLAIYNAVYDGRSDQALALSLVLVVLSFILFFIINLLEKSRI